MAAPKGNQHASHDRPWADALRRAVLRATGEKDAKKLDALAERLIERGLEGDVTAIREIGDRLDGKPRQQTEILGAGGGPLTVRVDVAFVEPDRPG